MKLRLLFVAVLVVLAGCNGVLSGESDEPVVMPTPASVPTDEPTPTPVPQLAPGLTGEGIENAGALIAAHSSFLRNRSFTTTTNATRLASNGTVLIRYSNTLRVGPEGEKAYSISKTNSSYTYSNFTFPVRIEVWWNDGQIFMKRIYRNGRTTYDRVRQRGYSASGAGLRDRLESFDTNNTVVAEWGVRNGTTLYRVRGTAQDSERGNVSIRFLVDSRGVIRSFRMVRRFPSRQSISKIVYETRFSRIGATDTPERPSWVDEALNRTTPIAEEPRGRSDETVDGTNTNETASKTTTG